MLQCEAVQSKADADFRWFKIYRHLGIALLGQNKYEEAYETYEKGLQYASDLLAADPTNEKYQHYFGIALQDVGTVERSLGQTDLAIERLERAHELFSRLMASDSYEGDCRYRIAFIESDLGSICSVLNRNQEAEDYLEDAVAVLEEVAGEQPSNLRSTNRLVHTLVRMSMFREKLSQFDEARKVNERALEVVQRMPATLMKFRHQMYLLNHQGNISQRQFGEYDRAMELFNQTCEIGEDAVVEFPSDESIRSALRESYRQLAILHDRRNDAEAAMPLIEKAVFHAMVILNQQPESRRAQDQAVGRVQYLAKRLGERQEFSAAEKAMIELADASPSSVRVQYQTARYLARLAAHRQNAGTTGIELFKAKSLAIEQLNKTVGIGFDNVKSLTEQPEWQVLRDTNEFEQIIQSLAR